MIPDLLYLAHRIPYPPDKGEKVRAFNEVKHLAQRYRVHLGAFVDDSCDMRHVAELQKLCGETYFARLVPALARIRSLRGLLTGEALSLGYFRDDGLARWVKKILATHEVRHIVAYSSPMSQYVRAARGSRRVADFVDVDSEKWREYAATRRAPLSWIYAREASALARFERTIAAEFDATLLVSPPEARLLRRLTPESAGRIHHVCNGVDTAFFRPQQRFENPYAASEQAIVFTGSMDYWPNIDAVRWFATNVFPEVRKRNPHATFCVVGARPASAVRKLNALDGVRVTGTVPDVRPYIEHARLAVAPLRIARGVQNKILEAMAMGKTVIASPEAATGIVARRGAELLVASEPSEFAEAVRRYLDSPEREAIGAAARSRVLATYGWHTSLARLDAILDGRAEGARERGLATDAPCPLGAA
jgi:sugar transferase (PEP-CTERM/EpsH1 system associated)